MCQALHKVLRDQNHSCMSMEGLAHNTKDLVYVVHSGAEYHDLIYNLKMVITVTMRRMNWVTDRL